MTADDSGASQARHAMAAIPAHTMSILRIIKVLPAPASRHLSLLKQRNDQL
jgi:hypothetical protein